VVGAAEVGFQVLGAGGGDVAQVADVDQARAGRRRRPPVDHLHGTVSVCSAAGGREVGPGARGVPAAQRRLRMAKQLIKETPVRVETGEHDMLRCT